MTDSPFHRLDRYIALPRIEGMVLSPDGRRAVLTVATLSADSTSYERALWEVPAGGGGTPRRLTRSAKGESGAAFLPGGDLLFVSSRPDAEDGDAEDAAQVWVLPAGGGEARALTALAGGVSSIAAVAAEADRALLSAELLPSASTLEDDRRLRSERRTRKVSAILHDTYPVRYWDHDLGPAEPHLFALDADAGAQTAAPLPPAPDDDSVPYPARLVRPVDLTPRPGRSAAAAGAAITPDGKTVIAALRVSTGLDERYRLVAIDVASGTHSPLFDEAEVDVEAPTISADGARIAFLRSPKSSPQHVADLEVWVADIDGANARRVATDWDRWATSLAFDPDGRSLIATADQGGRGPIFRIPVDGGPVEQLTDDDFTYTDVRVDHVSGDLVALRSSWIEPAHPVRIASDGSVTRLVTPAPSPRTSATMTEVRTVAEDGSPLRAWLLLPDGASEADPAPLLLWVHGGPLNSWNAWSWRWSPAVAVARGYAVLLPDPALSTGYGREFIARGWNDWGGAPYTDLMTITDAALERPDLDEGRTAAMGGSFGGYMANWIAGHTDRFRAIVTHASLWALDQFAGTTDGAGYWQRTFTPEAMAENSPHRFVDGIRTPMLVIHGDRDYRVPIGEGLRLWTDLADRFAGDDGSMVHRFLYFPDENHWVLKPQHAVVWYETVFAFLAEHVLGQDAQRPEVLG